MSVVPRTNLDHSEDRYIPYMIYMLSFVMNVGRQYTDEAAVKPQRGELQKVLKIPDNAAKNMEDKLGKLDDHYKPLAQPFAEAIGYGGVGCPRKIDTLLVLAEKWMSKPVQPQPSEMQDNEN